MDYTFSSFSADGTSSVEERAKCGDVDARSPSDLSIPHYVAMRCPYFFHTPGGDAVLVMMCTPGWPWWWQYAVYGLIVLSFGVIITIAVFCEKKKKRL
jgi:hypothetical protein